MTEFSFLVILLAMLELEIDSRENIINSLPVDLRRQFVLQVSLPKFFELVRQGRASSLHAGLYIPTNPDNPKYHKAHLFFSTTLSNQRRMECQRVLAEMDQAQVCRTMTVVYNLLQKLQEEISSIQSISVTLETVPPPAS